jgi:hypothetical protein
VEKIMLAQQKTVYFPVCLPTQYFIYLPGSLMSEEESERYKKLKAVLDLKYPEVNKDSTLKP